MIAAIRVYSRFKHEYSTAHFIGKDDQPHSGLLI
jgi:hypothetical protein